MKAKRWKNWYRVPDNYKFDDPETRRIACTLCGRDQILAKGEKFTSHCASFATHEEALEYAPRIYTFAEYLGPYEEGKRP